jgi:hypothetical protein
LIGPVSVQCNSNGERGIWKGYLSQGHNHEHLCLASSERKLNAQSLRFASLSPDLGEDPQLGGIPIERAMSRPSNRAPYGVIDNRAGFQTLYPAIARAFNIDHSAVKRGPLRGYEGLGGQGRH